jgi:hypothetical protein
LYIVGTREYFFLRKNMEKEVSGTQGPEFVSRDKGFDLNEHKFF